MLRECLCCFPTIKDTCFAQNLATTPFLTLFVCVMIMWVCRTVCVKPDTWGAVLRNINFWIVSVFIHIHETKSCLMVYWRQIYVLVENLLLYVFSRSINGLSIKRSAKKLFRPMRCFLGIKHIQKDKTRRKKKLITSNNKKRLIKIEEELKGFNTHNFRALNKLTNY